MITAPIYVPTGRAKEYGDYAINIYTGCDHSCTYCFAPAALHKSREEFHSNVQPRRDIVESVHRQLDREGITEKLIHLCFMCDPYPAGLVDTTPTREIIKLLKDSGNRVQILTKGGYLAERDFDLLRAGGVDRFGVTFTSWTMATRAREIEPNAAPTHQRLKSLETAKGRGIETWVSCEPVLYPEAVYALIRVADYIDEFKIGKLNHHKPEDLGLPPIDWAVFGRECERLCKTYGRRYYIKDDLRREMERRDGQA